MERAGIRTATQPLLALTALGSGVSLVFAIVFGAPLAWSLLLLAAAAVSLVGFRWSHSDAASRLHLRRRLSTGLVAGLAATAAYDVSRLALVQVGGLRVSPFKALPLFGQLLVGVDSPPSVALFAGAAYHLLNGVAFATAYCLLLGGRDWRLGILWALGLEAAMLAVYPGWLDLGNVLGEFAAMSILGHVAYGAVLGLVSQWRLGGDERTGARADPYAGNRP